MFRRKKEEEEAPIKVTVEQQVRSRYRIVMEGPVEGRYRAYLEEDNYLSFLLSDWVPIKGNFSNLFEGTDECEVFERANAVLEEHIAKQIHHARFRDSVRTFKSGERPDGC